jgi:lipopolysaccharide export system protein LptA
MTERKKKLIIIQISLLVIGSLIILFTYSDLNVSDKEKIITTETQNRIDDQLKNETQDGDIFFNIEYSGLDLAGNRFILKSKEAFNKKASQEIVNMKFVEAFFYFKDGTVLKILSDRGIYNNKTLDMDFDGNVIAKYEGSELFAQKAKYSNSKSFLMITNEVKVKDYRGTVFADKLFFDIKKQKLNIASKKDGKVNANVNLK